ncbi:MAG TPA: zinc ribbon domain-containing protein [Xanthomonadaceae bacterium]|nr:zinc ribbon domain-containing protein [Xanthomonadaceae bacterium]
MPIYEFECGACGHRLDRLQKLSDADPVDCPQCVAPALRRRVSAPSFRLAGSGWYETDFKTDKDRKRNLVDKEGPAQAKAEEKPAAAVKGKTDGNKAGDAPAVAPKAVAGGD